MTNLELLQLHTGETDENILNSLLTTAKNAIQARRYRLKDIPDELETRYTDLQFRIALDLYNKMGAEGELTHDENGIKRVYESSWVSEQLLREVTPYADVIGLASTASSSDDSSS